jgi:hypothetical protein
MHHAAFSNPDFQESWRTEPMAFCADCHAPERQALGAVGEHLGIGCGSCHVTPAGHGKDQARVATVSAVSCIPCHDFRAPGGSAFLQSMAREHLASPFAAVACVDCHMPAREGKRSHAFAASRNRDVLSRAIQISSVELVPAFVPAQQPGSAAPDQGAREVAVTLRTVNVGHRFPTGDIFRRLSVKVVAVGARGQIVCESTTHFNRNWNAHRAALRDHIEEALSDDNRLTAEPRTLRVRCAALPQAVQVSVDYARGKSSTSEHTFAAFETIEILKANYPLTFEIDIRPEAFEDASALGRRVPP